MFLNGGKWYLNCEIKIKPAIFWSMDISINIYIWYWCLSKFPHILYMKRNCDGFSWIFQSHWQLFCVWFSKHDRFEIKNQLYFCNFSLQHTTARFYNKNFFHLNLLRCFLIWFSLKFWKFLLFSMSFMPVFNNYYFDFFDFSCRKRRNYYI